MQIVVPGSTAFYIVDKAAQANLIPVKDLELEVTTIRVNAES